MRSSWVCQPSSSATSAQTTYAAEDCENLGNMAGPTEPPGPQPLSQAFPVPHVRQQHNWDCGLACVLMVLKALGLHQYDLPSLQLMCPTKSIWTIDLAHLLAKTLPGCAAGRLTFLTTLLGANPSFASQHYYAQHLAEDAARVARLFQDAPTAGIILEQRSVPLQELQSLVLAGQHLVIALVDKYTLGSGTCQAQAAPPLETGIPHPRGAASLSSSQYTGHYVLLCGYDVQADEFLLYDPAVAEQQLHVPAARLDAARRCFGTDEDLLLCPIPSELQRQ